MGDAACWLDRLCPECSAMLEDLEVLGAVTCWRCGVRVRLGDEGLVMVSDDDSS